MTLDSSKDGYVPRKAWVCGLPHEYSEEQVGRGVVAPAGPCWPCLTLPGTPAEPSEASCWWWHLLLGLLAERSGGGGRRWRSRAHWLPPPVLHAAHRALTPPSRVLYCARTTVPQVREYWTYFGELEAVDLLTFKDSGRFNGAAFITFRTQVRVRYVWRGGLEGPAGLCGHCRVLEDSSWRALEVLTPCWPRQGCLRTRCECGTQGRGVPWAAGAGAAAQSPALG
jgi:hypothetical protein